LLEALTGIIGVLCTPAAPSLAEVIV
jgi:hypothetical protein